MDEHHAFRFGVIGENIRSGSELLTTARRAEALGYSTLLLRDHMVTEPFGDQLAPLVALTAAAAATTTLRVGTMVIANDFRHPALLAKEIATLDELSGGRVELGLGAGWLRQEYERAGLAFDRASERIDRLAESIGILKRLWDGKAVTMAGTHYKLEGLDNFPLPVQRPRPPILIGGASRRILTLAGREADTVGLMSSQALPDGTLSTDLTERRSAALTERIGWVQDGAGDRFGDVELSAVVTVEIGDDPSAIASRIATTRGWGAHATDAVLDMPTTLLGPLDRIVEQTQALHARFGITYLVVSDHDMETFAPVVERLTDR